MRLRSTPLAAVLLSSLIAASCIPVMPGPVIPATPPSGPAPTPPPPPPAPTPSPAFMSAAGDTGGLPFRVEVEVMEMKDNPVFATAPSVHSAAIAVSATTGRWLIIGGRTNGFHGFTTTANFPRAYANDTIYVIDPSSTTGTTVWRYAVANLSAPEAIRDQFVATNFQSTVEDGILYLTGGYGVKNVSGADTMLVTYPMLTTMALDSVISDVMKGNDPSEHFSYTEDLLFQVTGGELLHLDGSFYLIMGNNFNGSYLSCVEGLAYPPCSQVYTNAIRPFTVDRSSGKPVVTWGTIKVDPGNFHRRDLTVTPTVFSDGSLGIGAYSGVFVPNDDSQADANLSYLYPVYIGNPNPAGAVAQVRPSEQHLVRLRAEQGQTAGTVALDTSQVGWRDDSFLQRMNQYSAANLLMFDPGTGTMFTTLFGGIGHYFLDGAYITSAGYPPGLQADPVNARKTIFNDRVPFIPYITTQVRNTLPSGRMVTVERVHGTPLPGFLGGEARFIPSPFLRPGGQLYGGTDEIIDYSKLNGRTFVGFIFGGMEATVEPAYPDWRSYGQFNSRATTKVMGVFVTPLSQ